MVAVKPADVNAVLNRPPSVPVVLVYGPDAGLVDERVAALMRQSLGEDPDPFAVVRIDGDALAQDAGRLADEANTIGLFGDRRVIIVRAGGRNITGAVKPLLEAPPRDSLTLIRAGDLARTAPLRTLCERSGQALSIPCYSDSPRELALLADAILGDFGLKLDRDSRAHLLTYLGADRQTTRNEIEKLALYARGQATVTIEDIDAVCGDASVLAMDGLVDSVFLGRLAALDDLSVRQFADGAEAGVLLSAMVRHGLMLIAARRRTDDGVPVQTVLDQSRVHFKRKDAVERQIRIWPSSELQAAVWELTAAVARSRKNALVAPEVGRVALWSVAMRAAARSQRI